VHHCTQVCAPVSIQDAHIVCMYTDIMYMCSVCSRTLMGVPRDSVRTLTTVGTPCTTVLKSVLQWASRMHTLCACLQTHPTLITGVLGHSRECQEMVCALSQQWEQRASLYSSLCSSEYPGCTHCVHVYRHHVHVFRVF